MSDPPWMVHCGQNHMTVAWSHDEAGVIIAARRHEDQHHCGTWYQSPLDGVAYYAPNVFVEVNDAHD